MSRPGIALVIAAIAVVAVLGLGVARTAEPLATLGHEVIRESDFERYITSVHTDERLAEIRRRSEAARAEELQAYLDARAIAEKARRVGILDEERFQKAAELMEAKILARLVMDRQRETVLKLSAVSPDEVRAYYEQHKHELTSEARFTAHHLLVYVLGNPAFPDKGLPDAAARNRAKAALASLRTGQTWQEVAARYSDDLATRHNAGIIRDGQFGYRAPEVERALRTQELGKPGNVIKTMFGYYVLEVKERILEGVPKAFDEVSETLKEQLTEQRAGEARKVLMAPIWTDVGFKLTDAGQRDVPLFDETAVAPDAVLAEVAGRPITEADFRWFCRDALLPRQRNSAYSRPQARQNMLQSFLDMLVLEAKARRDGLDKTPTYVRTRTAMQEQLLLEFLQERDKAGPAHQRWTTDEERNLAERAYFDRVRAEVGLTPIAARR